MTTTPLGDCRLHFTQPPSHSLASFFFKQAGRPHRPDGPRAGSAQRVRFDLPQHLHLQHCIRRPPSSSTAANTAAAQPPVAIANVCHLNSDIDQRPCSQQPATTRCLAVAPISASATICSQECRCVTDADEMQAKCGGGGGRCRVLPTVVTAGGISSDTATLAPPLLMVRHQPAAAGPPGCRWYRPCTLRQSVAARHGTCSTPRRCRVLMAGGQLIRGQLSRHSRRVVPWESQVMPAGSHIRVLA